MILAALHCFVFKHLAISQIINLRKSSAILNFIYSSEKRKVKNVDLMLLFKIKR
jgi:hypothetical protein